MIARMLHLPPEKNKLHNEQSAQSVKKHTAEYKIDNRSVYNILDQICKGTDLYPYVKQNKFKRDNRGAFYAIHSKWLGQNHVSMTASKAKLVLQMSMHDREKKVWTWEKYVARHVKYHIILGNLMEYEYQSLDPGLKVWYLLNGIRYDKLSTAVAAVWAHPDKYEKDFHAVIAFLTQCMDKRAPIWSMKDASVSQTRPGKGRRPALPMALSKEILSWRSTPGKSMTQCQQHSNNSCISSGRKLDS